MAILDTLGEDYFLDKTKPNLRYPPPTAIALRGYLGKALKRRPPEAVIPNPDPDANVLEPAAATVEYWRLYTSLQFNDYIEFREEDVITAQRLATPMAPTAGTLVWLKVGSIIEHVHVDTLELQAGFLQGSIAGGGGSGALAGGMGTGAPAWGGGTSIPCGGTSIPCGGTSIPCGGTSIPCGGTSIPCGGTSIPCGSTSLGCW
jgi:hypothetical protein